VRFTIKGSGDFTNVLPDVVKPGTKVLLDGPLGIFTKRAGQRDKYLLIAGGIGITPIRSLAEQLSNAGKDTELFYSASTEDQLVLSNELKQMNLSLRLQTGRVTLDLIKQAVPDFLEREIFICGPGPMIVALRDAFVSAGVPIKHIHYELFSL